MNRKKAWDTTRGLLYWRAKARMGAFVLLGCWIILFFVFYFGGEVVFGSGSYLYSGILSSLIVAIFAVFVFGYLKKKAKSFEEEWKKLEEEK